MKTIRRDKKKKEKAMFEAYLNHFLTISDFCLFYQIPKYEGIRIIQENLQRGGSNVIS